MALAGTGCTGKSADADGKVGAFEGFVAPSLQGKTLSGDYIQLSDFRGKVVLVNVWATWCKPCVKELPELGRLHGSLSAQGFTVLGVSVDKVGVRRVVENFVAKHGLKYPMILDPDGHAVGSFELKGYPTSMLIGRDGKVRWRRDGIIKENDGELGKQIELALAQPVPE